MVKKCIYCNEEIKGKKLRLIKALNIYSSTGGRGRYCIFADFFSCLIDRLHVGITDVSMDRLEATSVRL